MDQIHLSSVDQIDTNLYLIMLEKSIEFLWLFSRVRKEMYIILIITTINLK